MTTDEQGTYVCPFCDKELPDERAACCGEVGHAVENTATNPVLHEWDDDACCIHCGFDGAEAAWLESRLRIAIGNDEFSYRRKAGEFDASRYCEKAVGGRAK